jgi:hypothetical protein
MTSSPELGHLSLWIHPSTPGFDATSIENHGQEFLSNQILPFPSAFKPLIVGETFACTLQARNKSTSASEPTTVSNLEMQARMWVAQKPVSIPLKAVAGTASSELGPGASTQKGLEYEMKNPGTYLFEISATFSETASPKPDNANAGQAKAETKVCSIRRFYHFAIVPGLLLNLKIDRLQAALPEGSVEPTVPISRPTQLQYTVQIRLENKSNSIATVKVRSQLTPYSSLK